MCIDNKKLLIIITYVVHIQVCSKLFNKNCKTQKLHVHVLSFPLPQTLWMSLLHHVCNQHEWIDGKCTHEPINENQHDLQWFDRRDKDFQALQEVILAPRLLSSLKFYVKFR